MLKRDINEFSGNILIIGGSSLDYHFYASIHPAPPQGMVYLVNRLDGEHVDLVLDFSSPDALTYFKDRQFDIIYFHDAHTKKLSQALQHAHQLLCPDGILLFAGGILGQNYSELLKTDPPMNERGISIRQELCNANFLHVHENKANDLRNLAFGFKNEKMDLQSALRKIPHLSYVVVDMFMRNHKDPGFPNIQDIGPLLQNPDMLWNTVKNFCSEYDNNTYGSSLKRNSFALYAKMSSILFWKYSSAQPASETMTYGELHQKLQALDEVSRKDIRIILMQKFVAINLSQPHEKICNKELFYFLSKNLMKKGHDPAMCFTEGFLNSGTQIANLLLDILARNKTSTEQSPHRLNMFQITDLPAESVYALDDEIQPDNIIPSPDIGRG